MNITNLQKIDNVRSLLDIASDIGESITDSEDSSMSDFDKIKIRSLTRQIITIHDKILTNYNKL